MKYLDEFYNRRIANLSRLHLKEVLKRKNPYLMRAIGLRTAAELVEYILDIHTQASDETIFGDAFVEPIALAVSRGRKSGATGIDIEMEEEKTYKAIAVKSGPNIFNASQTARMNDEFQELQNRLRQHLKNLGKQFEPILGCSYGQRVMEPTAKRRYRIVSGQAFWQEITGDPDFYLKLMRLMRDYPDKQRERYQQEWANAVNRFTRDLLNDFADADGTLNWEKIVQFNSSAE
ncbi:MAG TPA: PmeII family type II restriction endonuclease [Chthonomonas sp.]|uniref:PmeII family type II restriction endonuclease n=1 Tax=Chthonomonas sp. TaxID=2282153 RepID=UPI002B4ADDCE|nr:PmeII family type II restriction endonuclease [Chthonomonas sp.]HLI48517.1 PmeII family type II restriction endonuclease [Chthonomonas sp.]